MSIEITMPRLNDTMEQGTIIKWSVQEGDAVSAGDAVADIETDKAIQEMQVYDDGRIARIVVPEGRTVEVGTLIAVLAEEDEDPADIAAAANGGAAAPRTKAKSEPAPGHTDDAEAEAAETVRTGTVAVDQRSPADGRIKVSPVARRLAEEHGVDLRTLQGSGPVGRIVKRDVLRAVEARTETTASVPPSARQPVVQITASSTLAAPAIAAAPPPAETALLKPGPLPLSNMRQTIARRLVESKQTIPHYQVTMTFDMDALLSLRETLNEQLEGQGVKLSVNDFLVRACALAIHQYPEFNASWGGDHLDVHGDVNVGIAIALPRERGGGLVVGSLRNADRKSLRAISQESRHLAEKARTRGLSLEDMSDTTFAISNLGMFGVEHFTAIINPPNSAILAVGAAIRKPVVRDGEMVVGSEMSATLSLDHRIIDGATAAQYMQTLKQLIENPATLLV